ncbi:MAG: glycosyltransferase [Acidobacteria bacterium]|nr:glycosyltransferase [Acidobacteriota bacterium]
MEFTGERFIPTEQGRIRLEHYHRYAMVLEMVRGKVVLDVACGEGYGSYLMADTADSVIGVDVSDEVIRHATSVYGRPNLVFSEGSVTSLPFPSDSFDVVVSFETVEHVAEQEQMLAEIRRVLRPNGLLVISSPNRPIYSEESGEHNKFHVRELDFQEFDDLLRSHFTVISYFGQRLLMSSVIQPLDARPTVSSVWSDDGERLERNAAVLRDPIYFVAICGSAEVGLPDPGMSALYPATFDLVKHYVGFAKWAISLNAVVATRDKQVADRDAQIATLLNSTSWRLTVPLRRIGRWTAPFRAMVKVSVKTALKLARYSYRWLPLSFHTKSRHRHLIAKFFPRLLLAAGSHPSTISQYNIPLIDVGKLVTEVGSVDAGDVVLLGSESPIVTLVIVVEGSNNHLLNCLSSIAGSPPKVPFELVLVADGLPSGQRDEVAKIRGVRLQHHKEPQGIACCCNAGARAARGRYLQFLSADTLITSGWLDNLLQTFTDFPGAGLSGSRLLGPNGRLEEAGAIIWRDGRTAKYGCSRDPQLPQYNYAREVDFCSGISIMVPRDLFFDVGGFTEDCSSMGEADCDLALKIRDKGYRVLYQPFSTVIHLNETEADGHHPCSPRNHDTTGVRRLLAQWGDHLQNHQLPAADEDRVRDRGASRRVLVLDHCTPAPDQDSGSITLLNNMLLLREMGFQVTFMPESDYLYTPEYTAALQRVGIEVLYTPYTINVAQHLKSFGRRYDLVFLFRPGVAERQLRTVRKYSPQAKVLFHTVDLHFLRLSREASVRQDQAGLQAAEEMKRRELTAIKSTDASIVLSTAELELLKPMVPEARLYVTPLILDVKGARRAFGERKDIVFVGGYQHPPNVDAVLFFVREVMPLLRREIPGIRFHVVGSKVPPEIEALGSEDIVITGYVPNLTPLLDRMRVSVAPLRYGAGIKGKIGTAMTAGLPVVATTIAAEGMSLTCGDNILVADGPEAFAEAVVRVYRDEALWNRLGANGLDFASRTWGAEAAWQILARILADLGIRVERGPHPLYLYPG